MEEAGICVRRTTYTQHASGLQHFRHFPRITSASGVCVSTSSRMSVYQMRRPRPFKIAKRARRVAHIWWLTSSGLHCAMDETERRLDARAVGDAREASEGRKGEEKMRTFASSTHTTVVSASAPALRVWDRCNERTTTPSSLLRGFPLPVRIKRCGVPLLKMRDAPERTIRAWRRQAAAAAGGVCVGAALELLHDVPVIPCSGERAKRTKTAQCSSKVATSVYRSSQTDGVVIGGDSDRGRRAARRYFELGGWHPARAIRWSMRPFSACAFHDYRSALVKATSHRDDGGRAAHSLIHVC
ncbi:hypothetical protein C8R47DRAFT_1136342 [Mycena vitilis]|nr:hypothetical protein C8R47DRAFT_1136342 [Mycena vitilis]